MKVILDIPDTVLMSFQIIADSERRSRKSVMEKVLADHVAGMQPPDGTDERIPEGRDTPLGRKLWKLENAKK